MSLGVKEKAFICVKPEVFSVCVIFLEQKGDHQVTE